MGGRGLPEGPEIRRVADKVGRVLNGQTLTSVRAPWANLAQYESLWLGLHVISVRPRGKALLTQFSNGDILYSHNQLYGRWLTRKTHKQPSSNRSLRLALSTQEGSVYLYSATDIQVLREGELAGHPYLSQLGPDVLDSELKVVEISRRLKDSHYRNRQLGTLLLDQNFLAGPGNYLRSEILFESRLHPRTKPSQLDAKQRTSLSRNILKICRRAYEHQGVTLEPELAKRLKKQGQKKRQYRHYVFSRRGQSCRLCETEVIRFDISSRAVFVCPECQSLPGDSP